jgi:exo-1,4-beta-D-glucosaminidase
MKVSAKIYNIDAKEKASKNATLDLAPDSSTKAFELPAPDALSSTYFLKLQLHDSAGKLVSDNFYWLSTKADTLDWAGRSDTVYTPQKDFADLTQLNNLPKTKVAVTNMLHLNSRESGAIGAPVQWISFTVANNGNSVAFMVHPRLTRGKGGDDAVPVFWSDNYFSLLPGEKRTVTVEFERSSLAGATPELVVDGWNVESVWP